MKDLERKINLLRRLMRALGDSVEIYARNPAEAAESFGETLANKASELDGIAQGLDAAGESDTAALVRERVVNIRTAADLIAQAKTCLEKLNGDQS